MRHGQLAVIAGAQNHGVVGEVPGFESIEQLEDLRVNLLNQVRIEARIDQLTLARLHVAGRDRQELPERAVHARLGQQVVVEVRGQIDRQILEVGEAIAAAREGRLERDAANAAARILLDVVRIDQRNDQAKRLVAVVGVDEVHRAFLEHPVVIARMTRSRAGAVDVTAIVVDRAATEIVQADRVAHVWRIPAVEAVAISEMRDVGVRPVMPLQLRVVVHRPRQVQLALEHDVIAGGGHHLREVGQAARQHRLAALAHCRSGCRS